MRRLLTRQWLGTHIGVLVLVAAFLALGWWQAVRAGDGNARSFGYALEWPTFAIIIVFLWVRAMRAELRRPPGEEPSASVFAAGRRAQVTPVTPVDDDDPELAAYNRYLADLHNRDLQSHS